MQSFLAYIADQYRHKKEDVATDALTYLLSRHKTARVAFKSFVAECGYPLPKIHSIVSRTREANGVGVPDIQISDRNDCCCAIVENKFWAGLTNNQPLGYFKKLSPEGLILFLVPEARITTLWTCLQMLCLNAGRPIEQLQDKRFSGRSARHHLCVASWEKLIPYLRTSLDITDTQDSKALVFIDQLWEVCEVAKQEHIQEHIEAFDSIEITDKHMGRRVKNYSYLATAIAKAAAEKQFFRQLPDKRQQSWNSCGEGYSGRYGEMAGYISWIGFDADNWSTRAISPLWLSFDDEDDIDELSDLFDHEIQAKTCFKVDGPRGGPALILPIPITPGVETDNLIEDAVAWLQTIELRLRSLSDVL
jgi:hypothetical protein